MDRLQAMETFVRVVEAGSFRKAADTMHVLPSTVTRTIKELESYLEARLLHRTTRALSVTDVGLRYYDNCKALLRDAQLADEMASQRTGVLRGSIKVGTTPTLARDFIIPALPHFTARYPGIDLDLHLSDATVDVIQHGLDCVVRTGEPRPSRLIARRLGAFRWYVCASPRYLELHGEPEDVDALKRHTAVGFIGSTGRSGTWTFRSAEQWVAVPMTYRISVNDTDAYVAAGVAGLGLIRAASYMVRERIAQGRLVRLLADIEVPPEPISILYPQSRHLSPAIRAFTDWCAEVIGSEAAAW
ncbi:LysR family transcriptional regulator [Bordetella genomosp. 8]|uniref:LysR family transcriptional regulator n=1 Tax=Bordetella genomosp. 8 TaxID=1416806 RepID=A0A1W6YIE9_9BORD|nr:LysR substrate-binding domain-containing protein [Bordetella genomosp. 8]ARP80333.1 LysR family transcriptional regulator [Bordetella genomosp. 8]